MQDAPAPQNLNLPRKFNLFSLILIPIVLIVIASFLFIYLRIAGISQKKSPVSPTTVISSIPSLPPSIPESTRIVASPAVSRSAEKIGRLVFIKDGDIYQSDLASFSLLVKTASPAADKLSWSPKGNFLTWRSKTITGLPNELAIYDRKRNAIKIIQTATVSSELKEYSWSPDENKIALLIKNSDYSISIYPVSTAASEKTATLVNSSQPIKELVWLNENTLLYSTLSSIISQPLKADASELVTKDKIQYMNLSPDRKKLLYSTGDDQKSSLFIREIETEREEEIPLKPDNIDMGTTNLAPDILDKGFIPYAVWFLDSQKLLLGYHYFTNVPLVGIFNLQEKSFTAISATPLNKNDFFVDDLRLIGARVNNKLGQWEWQVSLLTLEDNAKLSTQRVIPGASSPAIYLGD